LAYQEHDHHGRRDRIDRQPEQTYERVQMKAIEMDQCRQQRQAGKEKRTDWSNPSVYPHWLPSCEQLQHATRGVACAKNSGGQRRAHRPGEVAVGLLGQE